MSYIGMYCKFTISLLCLSMLWSCSEPLQLDYSDDAELLLECELSTSRRIEARLMSLGNFNDITSGEYIEDAIIDLGTNTDLALRFQYDSRNKVYFIPVESHMVNPAYIYTIKAYRFKNDPHALEAVTTIPSGHKIVVTSKPVVKDVLNAKSGTRKEINLKLALPDVEKKNGFFRLKAYRKLFEKQNVNGNIVYVHKGAVEPREFGGNDQEPLAFHLSAVDGDILFDVNRVDKRNFDLRFYTLGKVEEGDHFEAIYYVLEGLSEATYRYNVSKSKQINAEVFGNSDPVISYKNMINGYGFLGGSSAVRDSILFQ
ncbi:MAG: DUF4249 family protein [Saprospiraceae bacterium]|nr:DUF4249 family protein [Saprospiraceae bacterium]